MSTTGSRPSSPTCRSSPRTRHSTTGSRPNLLIKLGNRVAGTDRQLSAAAARYHSPLNYAPLVPRDRRLIITGLGDRLAPPERAELLWEHWDRCAFHWFPGNHVLHVSQPDYLRRMTRFLQPFMFS